MVITLLGFGDGDVVMASFREREREREREVVFTESLGVETSGYELNSVNTFAFRSSPLPW
jgi:hypothetical protein